MMLFRSPVPSGPARPGCPSFRAASGFDRPMSRWCKRALTPNACCRPSGLVPLAGRTFSRCCGVMVAAGQPLNRVAWQSPRSTSRSQKPVEAERLERSCSRCGCEMLPIASCPQVWAAARLRPPDDPKGSLLSLRAMWVVSSVVFAKKSVRYVALRARAQPDQPPFAPPPRLLVLVLCPPSIHRLDARLILCAYAAERMMILRVTILSEGVMIVTRNKKDQNGAATGAASCCAAVMRARRTPSMPSR